METLDIVINGIKYDYIDSMAIDGKNYVAYTDGKVLYIQEYYYQDNEVYFSSISDAMYKIVKERMDI